MNPKRIPRILLLTAVVLVAVSILKLATWMVHYTETSYTEADEGFGITAATTPSGPVFAEQGQSSEMSEYELQNPGDAHRSLIYKEGSKYPWRIRSEDAGKTLTYAAGHVIITFPETVESHNIPGYRIEQISPASLKVAWNDQSPEAFDRQMQRLSELFPDCWVEPDYLYKTDAWTEGEWVHDNEDRIGHRWLYENGYNANGIVIAVLDSGVFADHPELTGAIFTNSQDPVDGYDNDGNGFVDDQTGWDFVNNDRNPDDDEGHGTAMAGLMAADGSNGIGVAGWAPGCTILPLKVLDHDGEGFESDIIKAIDYVTGMGIPIINASWGKEGSVSNSLNSAIQRFSNNGGLFVTSAGNDHQDIDVNPYSPASSSLTGIIAVGGLNSYYNGRDGYSNFGQESVDILCPDSMRVLALDGDITGSNGTSLASAVISSMAAVLWKNNPHLDAFSIKERLLETSIFAPGNIEMCKYPGYPNFSRMLTDTRSPVPQIISYTLDKDPYHVGEDVAIRFEIAGDEHHGYIGDGWNTGMLLGDVLTVEATLEEKVYEVEVIGLNGSHAIDPIKIKAQSSAPYIQSEIPSLIQLEELDSTYQLDLLDIVRGDRPLHYDWYHAGTNKVVYSHTISFSNSISLTGLHEFTIHNDAGSIAFSITARWNGMTEASHLMPMIHPMSAGSNLVQIAAGISSVFDGAQTTHVPHINLVGRNSQGIGYGGYLLLTGRPALVTSDGITWNRYDVGNSPGEIVGIYGDALVTDEHSYVYLLKIGQDSYDHISVPSYAIGDYIAGGNILLSVEAGKVWKYQGGDTWTLTRENVPPIARRFYSDGTFILISNTDTVPGDDGPREVADILYSADGETWTEDQITFPGGIDLHDLFTYNQQPCLVLDGFVATYDVLAKSWVPLVDLVNKEILVAGLNEALAVDSYYIAGGQVFCRPLDGIPHTTAQGVFLGNGGGMFHSRDLLDWTQVSLEPAAVRDVNGTTYMVDTEGLYIMDGANKTRVADGLRGSNYLRLSTMRGMLFGYGITGDDTYRTWYILDPVDMQWKSDLETEDFFYRYQNFYYEKIAVDQWRSISASSIYNEEPTHYRGRSMQYFGGGEWDYRPMDDAVQLPQAAYDYLPNAAYTNIGNWFTDPQMGWLNGTADTPWVWSPKFGWLGSSFAGPDGHYLYSSELGWVYYHAAYSPYIYSFTMASWLTY